MELGTYKIGGAMADYCVTDNKAIIPIGDDFSFEQASSFFVNPLTAIAMVERCKELGSKATIVTAACSQIGRMILPLLIMNGITPICTVRKEDQAELLRAALGERYGKYVINTSKPDYKQTMGAVCMKLRPQTCLECISGDTTGDILKFIGFGSTLILYGLLSDKPAGNINTIDFIGKNQTIESFLLSIYLAKKTQMEYLELVLKAEALYKTVLKTQVNAEYGLH